MSAGPAPAAPPRDARGAVLALTATRAPDCALVADFWLAAGEAAILQGPAGSGKTRFLDMLRLVAAPEGGDMRVFGVAVEGLAEAGRVALRRRMGAVTQPPRFLEHLSAAQNVAAPLALSGRPARDYSRNVDELLDFVGLSAADDRPMSALNETARRRTAIARAIVTSPELILLDEPLAGLAPDAAQRLLKMLLGMRQAGAALVFATQSAELAEALGAPIWRIAQGRLWPPKEGP